MYRRCGCRDENTGRLLGARCQDLRSPSHGSWCFSWPDPAEALRPVAGSTDPAERIAYATEFLFGTCWPTGGGACHDLHHYHRAAGNPWKFCFARGGGTHAEFIAGLLDRMTADAEPIDWWEREPRHGPALLLIRVTVTARRMAAPQRQTGRARWTCRRPRRHTRPASVATPAGWAGLPGSSGAGPGPMAVSRSIGGTAAAAGVPGTAC